IESAANDPMAILLTLVVVEGLASGTSGGLLIVPLFLWMFLAGPLIGWLMASGALAIFNRLNPQERGFYYVLLLAVVLLTYGVSELIQASGMLAVFTAGFVMGNRHFIYKQGVRNFSAALSMIANIGVFVMMGLLVFPHQWSELWFSGLVLFLVLTFIARPAAVWIGTLGMKVGLRERHFMCWAGLRGAVPIVLATYPMAAGLPIGEEVFNLVFFAVLLSILMQGSTLGILAKRLGLSEPARPQPRYGLELVAMSRSDLDLFVVELPGPQGQPGPRIRELALPPRALITLITRGSEVIPPTGHTRLLGWDQVTVLARLVDEKAVHTALVQPFNRSIETEEYTARILDTESTESLETMVAMNARHKKVVLLGHGRVGAVLAHFLRQRKLPFIVIEQDLTIVERLRRTNVPVVHGEGDNPAVLDRAGIADAQLLLITSAEPITVRRTIKYARQVNSAIEIVVRVHQPAELKLLRDFPQTQCVYSAAEIAYAMARLMLHELGVSVVETEAILINSRRDQSGLSVPRTRITEIHVSPTSAVLGKKLSELGLPRGALLITISRNGEFVVPNGQTEILADDALLVLADTETASDIEQLILMPHSENS
ncbi:MAG TPA: cation:proton antiporter, partial [Woeseiaceae bacterium]